MNKRPREMQNKIEKALNNMYYKLNITNYQALKKEIDQYYFYKNSYIPITIEEIKTILKR